jgi:hypothetical protein
MKPCQPCRVRTVTSACSMGRNLAGRIGASRPAGEGTTPCGAGSVGCSFAGTRFAPSAAPWPRMSTMSRHCLTAGTGLCLKTVSRYAMRAIRPKPEHMAGDGRKTRHVAPGCDCGAGVRCGHPPAVKARPGPFWCVLEPIGVAKIVQGGAGGPFGAVRRTK